MEHLEDAVALVTGAGSPRGIGRAIVEQLAARGVNIVASDIATAAPDEYMLETGYRYGADMGLDETVAAAKKLGVSAIGLRCDITSPGDVDILVEEAMQVFKRIDILVNVAGGSWGSNRIGDYAPELWLKTLQTNLFGTFLTCRAVLPIMEQQESGAIVNIASIAAIRAHPLTSAYNAAKAGVVQFTRDIAVEYGPLGIRANCLLPGDIQTDLLAAEHRGMAEVLEMPEEEIAELSACGVPLRKLGTPREVAAAAVFLCSPEASFITGLAMPVSGGRELSHKAH